MYNAPSVSFPVGRSRMAGGLLAMLWAAGAAAVLGCFLAGASVWACAGMGAAVLLAAALAWRGACRAARGALLAWDGQGWSLMREEQGDALLLHGAQAGVHLDFQVLMLVRLTQAGRPPAWLWVERRRQPLRWLDLRRALHAPVSLLPAGGTAVSP